MNNDIEIEEQLIGFEALYTSMLKCKKGVSWKDSVAAYCLHGIENTIKLQDELSSGKYKPRKPKKITLTHPKKREAVSISFRDRVYQRSLNDNCIYPTMTENFVDENCACQKGKGTDYARNLLKVILKIIIKIAVLTDIYYSATSSIFMHRLSMM